MCLKLNKKKIPKITQDQKIDFQNPNFMNFGATVPSVDEKYENILQHFIIFLKNEPCGK